MEERKIAVLTSGGDAPGMNAAVRAVVRTGCENHVRVLGINRGFAGLMDNDIKEYNIRDVSDIIHRGGTKLLSARSREFMTEAGMQKAIDVCKNNHIEGIVVIGGDGSFRGARDLSVRGVNCVGVPGTIDNDIGCCDYTIGYDTALNTIMDMVDRIRDTCESHQRCIVVEVMGRRAGFLALNAGIAIGATAILLPEIPFTVEKDVIERIRRTQGTNKKHFVIVVAEGVADTLKEQGVNGVFGLSDYIQHTLQIESRASVLGYVQRGGSPSVKDRVVGSLMGNYATHLLLNGVGNRVVAMQQEKIVDFDIVEALDMKKSIDLDMYRVAMEISI